MSPSPPPRPQGSLWIRKVCLLAIICWLYALPSQPRSEQPILLSNLPQLAAASLKGRTAGPAGAVVYTARCQATEEGSTQPNQGRTKLLWRLSSKYHGLAFARPSTYSEWLPTSRKAYRLWEAIHL